MRIALITLAASSAIAAAAFAQEPVSAPLAPAAAPAPAPAADPAAAAPAPAADPAAAAAVAPPAEAPQVLAPLPTDPLGLAVLDTMEKVCKPIANRTGTLDALAKADGYALKKKLWTKQVDAVSTLVLQPTSTANPTTCTVTLSYVKGGFQNLVNGLHAWASREQPVLQLRAPYSYEDQINKVKRTTVGWEAPSPTSATGMTGLAFTQLARFDNRDITKGADTSELLYQIRP
jgi:hypothetical protein